MHLHTLIAEDNGERRNPFAQEKMKLTRQREKKTQNDDEVETQNELRVTRNHTQLEAFSKSKLSTDIGLVPQSQQKPTKQKTKKWTQLQRSHNVNHSELEENQGRNDNPRQHDNAFQKEKPKPRLRQL